MNKCYSTNQEEYYIADSIEEFAEDYVATHGVEGNFSVWEADPSHKTASDYAKGMGEWLAENMEEKASEGGCDYAADWKPFTGDNIHLFEVALMNLIDKYANQPNFFNALNPKKVDMVADENGDVHLITT